MKSLSTFIRFYFLIGVAFLIPLASSTITTSSVDFDENSQFGWIFEAANSQHLTVIKYDDIEAETERLAFKYYQFTKEASEENLSVKQVVQVVKIQPDFWTTLHSVESKQGKLLYRPSNKSRNCDTTSSPCGHHQLSLQALKDISCSSNQCKSDRENFTKSLAMSKQLQTINDKRLKKAGYTNLPEYQKYLIHQQGATGLKIILAASQGEKLLSRNMKRNMAGNSPYSYKKLRRFGSKLAAKKFLKHWEEKWQDEKELVIATNTPNKSVEAVIKQEPELEQPLFNEYELQIALNLKM
jgi:hypothetical protein